MSLLEVSQLRAGYGPVNVLHDVALAVDDGEIAVVLGANGAGKTTTIRAISGTIHRSGDVTFAGRSIVSSSAESIVRAGIAQVPQGRGTFPELSVLDNLRIASHRSLGFSVLAEMIGLPGVRRAEDAARDAAIAVAERLGLGACIGMRTGSLPYGHRKLLELGRVILLGARHLLLDEPIAGLNEEEIEQLAALVLELRRDGGLSILLVEHNMGLVRRLCDRAVVLDAGQVIAEGTPAEVLANPRVLMAYLGELPGDA